MIRYNTIYLCALKS